MGNCLAKDGDTRDSGPEMRPSHIDLSWPDDFGDTTLSNIPDVVVENGKLTLDLSFLKLKSLPEKVCRTRNVEVLNINCNNISNFPYNFAALRDLKELYLRNNYLEFLPAQVCTLINLEVLELNRNLIETLPYCVSHLHNLRKLNLAFNNIKALPPSVRYLKELQYLNMEGNDLQCIPEVVFSLSSLEVLVLSDNEIASLPHNLENLVNLKELHIDDNKLTELPVPLLQFLSRLDIINVSNNANPLTLTKSEKPNKQIHKQKVNHVDPKETAEDLTGSSIPQQFEIAAAKDSSMVFSEINLNHPEEARDIFEGELGGFVDLKSEDAKPNAAERGKRKARNAKTRVSEAMRPSPKWRILFRELKKAGFLPTVNVQLPKREREPARRVKVVSQGSRYTWRGWRVETDPESVSKRRASSTSEFGDKLDEFGHPESISQILPAVKMEGGRLTLDLSWQELTYISGTVCELVNLNTLVLDFNQLEDLPFGIGNLSRLRILRLNSNKMTCVPENLRYLNHLRRLYLNENHIKAFPDWVESFQKLTYLSVEDNNMPFFPGEICSLVKLEYLLLAGNKIKELPEKN